MKRILLFVLLTLVTATTWAQSTLNFDPALVPFYHGVASGDPTPTSVIIWTRVTPPNNTTYSISGTYQVATDTGFSSIVKTGAFTADTSRDFTVKIDVTGLTTGSVYYYRFKALGANSLVGRAKTLPASSVSNLKFVVVSCQNYEGGFFNAYSKIAERNDIDAVLFLGDYIYEYGKNVYGINLSSRTHLPINDIVTLPDYRTRYSEYRLDKSLIRAHQQHTWVTVWDDHEFANNAFDTGAENHNPATQGLWSVRKAIAKRVYFEWIPIRDNVKDTVHRKLSYGNLCDLIMLDTRMEGRQAPPLHFDTPDTGTLARNIVSNTQMNWLINSLKNSTAKWKVLGNQTLYTNANLGFAAGFTSGTSTTSVTKIDSIRAVEDQFTDSWKGFPRQRKQLLDSIKWNNINNVVFVTGDSHSSWAWDVPETPVYYPLAAAMNVAQPHAYDAVTKSGYNGGTQQGSWAVEYAGPSITSQNLGEILGAAPSAYIASIINQPITALGGANYNPNLRYLDMSHHGYFILDLTSDSVHADYYFVNRVDTTAFTQSLGVALKTAFNSNIVSSAGGAAPPKATQDIPTPVNPQSSVGVAPVTKKAVILSVYPNPAQDELFVQIGFEKAATVVINAYDMTGKKVAVLTPSTTVQNGAYNFHLSLAGLASAGNYVVSVESAEFKESFLIVKK